jgi:hypothetical protein
VALRAAAVNVARWNFGASICVRGDVEAWIHVSGSNFGSRAIDLNGTYWNWKAIARQD